MVFLAVLLIYEMNEVRYFNPQSYPQVKWTSCV
jgi:hypothetical protein